MLHSFLRIDQLEELRLVVSRDGLAVVPVDSLGHLLE
jgi:hypothetical protein